MISFWFRRIQFVIYRLDNIFSKIHVAQLMVLKIKFFCQRDIRSANSTSYHVRKLKMAMANCFYVTLGRDIMRNCSLYIQKRVQFQN